MYREAYLELKELARTNPALAEKVANEILGGIEKVAAEQVPSFAEVMTKVAGIFPDEVDFLQKIAFNFADAMHAQGLSPEELEKKLQQTAFKNDPAGAIGKRVGQATETVSGAAANAAGTISDTVLGAGDTIRDAANGAKETVGKKAKGLKAGIGNVADDIALKGMYAGDAIKDGVGGVADDIALKGMYAGDAIKGGADDALLKAMYGVDWIKANPGKSALIGGGAAGAGVSAVALLNAIKNSKDEKVAAIWDEFIEKKALDETQKANLKSNRKNLRNPVDEKNMNPEQLRAFDYLSNRSSEDPSGVFRTIADWADTQEKPEYAQIKGAIEKSQNSALIGLLLGMGAGAVGGGAVGNKVGQNIDKKTNDLYGYVTPKMKGLTHPEEAIMGGTYGSILGMIPGALAGQSLSERKNFPDIDPALAEQFAEELKNAPLRNMKK